MRFPRWLVLVMLVLVAVLVSRATGGPAAKSPSPTTRVVTSEERLDALARAAVWHAPTVEIPSATFGPAPDQPQSMDCRFEVGPPSGTAPKFNCTLASGERIRVKYGSTPEIHSEVAASRLMRALGFGADQVTLVETLRCFGCPSSPFFAMKAINLTHSSGLYSRLINYKNHQDFTWVLVERRSPAPAIATAAVEGWAFHELHQIDAAKGGAPRAQVDALRLMAVFLAHWDNKAENQRLVCLSQEDAAPAGPCLKPFAMIQDLGGEFGPRKVDLGGWEAAPIWGNRATCETTMASLPYKGATFQPVQVTEAGRRHLSSLLEQVSDRQIEDLFKGARFDLKKSFVTAPSRPVSDWVRVFKSKVRQISDGPSCPRA